MAKVLETAGIRRMKVIWGLYTYSEKENGNYYLI